MNMKYLVFTGIVS